MVSPVGGEGRKVGRALNGGVLQGAEGAGRITGLTPGGTDNSSNTETETSYRLTGAPDLEWKPRNSIQPTAFGVPSEPRRTEPWHTNE